MVMDDSMIEQDKTGYVDSANKRGAEEMKKPEEVRLTTEDGLTFRTMEAEFYKDQIALQNAQNAAQEKLRGLNDFVTTMHTKYGKDQKVSYIDPKTFVFTDRVAPEGKK